MLRGLTRPMGLQAIYQAPKGNHGASDLHPDHRVYPYLLRGLTIERANQVWSTDITVRRENGPLDRCLVLLTPMRRGFLYLVAIMDWWSRKVLAWRLSNTMDVDVCVEALEAALARHGKPGIFNTDHGSQFTSLAFTRVLKDAGVKISMGGKGRWVDSVFIERPWRILKYACVYLQAFETGAQARTGIGGWIDYYNKSRPHSVFDGRTPEALAA